jgi:acyl dehydratase
MENIPFDEIAVGDSASLSRTLCERDLFLFAEASGDYNPIHIDAQFAAASEFGERIAHGAWSGALISALLSGRFPGPGTVYRSQQLTFRTPVRLGDTVTASVTVREKRDRHRLLVLDCTIVNQEGKTVARGSAEVIAPARKIRLAAPAMPPISIG